MPAAQPRGPAPVGITFCTPAARTQSNGHQASGPGNGHTPAGNGHQNGKSGGSEPASNKQVQFLQTLAKREKLYGQKLEGLIEEIAGRRCTPYDLTKAEAGRVIDHLNADGANNDRG